MHDLIKILFNENLIFEMYLTNKAKCVIDNINSTKADRARYIERAKAAGFKVISYFFETDLNSILEWNNQRINKAHIPEVYASSL